MKDRPKVSRDAEILAACLFPNGKMSLTFKRPHIIHPRTFAALHELAAAGIVEPIPYDDLRDGSRVGWRVLTGNNVLRYRKPAKAESFPITTE